MYYDARGGGISLKKSKLISNQITTSYTHFKTYWLLSFAVVNVIEKEVVELLLLQIIIIHRPTWSGENSERNMAICIKAVILVKDY